MRAFGVGHLGEKPTEMVAFQQQPHGTGAGVSSVRRSCPCIAFHRPGQPGATSSSKTKQTAGSVHLQVCHCPNLQETLSWIRISWQQHHPEKFVDTKEPWQPRWKDKIAGFSFFFAVWFVCSSVTVNLFLYLKQCLGRKKSELHDYEYFLYRCSHWVHVSTIHHALSLFVIDPLFCSLNRHVLVWV